MHTQLAAHDKSGVIENACSVTSMATLTAHVYQQMYSHHTASGVNPNGFDGQEGHQQLQILHGLQGRLDGWR